MAQVKLPWELVEEILNRVPPLSLTRFRTVCKQWNTLFNDKMFITNHLALVYPQFLLWTNTKFYSVEIINLNDDPKVEMHELHLHIPYLRNAMPIDFSSCHGVLFSESWSWNGAAIWNPWLKQTRWIESMVEGFTFLGIGYANDKPEKGHKVLGYSLCNPKPNDDNAIQNYRSYAVYEFGTNAWKRINANSVEDNSKEHRLSSSNSVSLNGNMYWPAINHEENKYLIKCFDFSKEIIKTFCALSLRDDGTYNIPILSTYRRDRLSMMKTVTETNTVEIWVTKNKVDEDGENVVWVNFMTVSLSSCKGYCQCYFIDYNVYGKSLVICCQDENERACIYIVKGNESKKIPLGSAVSEFRHIPYAPSLVPITTREF